MSSGRPDFTDFSLMRGQQTDGTLTIIATDEYGNIIGLLKGQYDTTLVTLRTDVLGRILCVLTDPEDVTGQPSYIGLGEHAARLGCIQSFDRRGNMVLYEDFESPTPKYTTYTVNSGSVAARSVDTAQSGSYALKLTAGLGSGALAGFYKYIRGQPLSRFGMEVSFTMVQGTGFFAFTGDVYTGEKQLIAGIKYSPEDEKLYYLDDEYNYQELETDLALVEDIHAFHTVKIVFDTTTQKYSRVLLDGVVYTLTEDLYDFDATDTPYVYIQAHNSNSSGSAKTIYVDDLIFTNNEPE